MPITRNQAANSTNEVEEDMLQRLNAKVEQQQKEAEERHKLAKERYKEMLKIAEEREEKLRHQLAAMKATREKPAISTPSSAKGSMTFWVQPFSEEIEQTPIPQNFKEVITESFDESQDPHTHL
ncbi:hypothetical protein CR513_52844, partial [Mucuna pruriens]